MLGEDRVTSIDIGPYLTQAAGRLSGIGLSPKIITYDATGPPPGIHHPSRRHLLSGDYGRPPSRSSTASYGSRTR